MRAAARPSVAAYRGLATWLDIYDREAWANPERAVQVMAAHGVRTLFLETSSYRVDEDVVRPELVTRFVTTAHGLGIRVVAWYVPGLADLAGDYRRALAAVRFRTADGGRFDAFGLDIEASLVEPPTLRSSRAVTLSGRIRRIVPASYPLAAIVPSPRGMELEPHYWPGFPYRALGRLFDVFVPMAYFTYRTSGAEDAYDYTIQSIDILRREVGADVRIHVVGGVAASVDVSEARAFVRAAREGGAIGASLYDFTLTRPAHWAALAAF